MKNKGSSALVLLPMLVGIMIILVLLVPSERKENQSTKSDTSSAEIILPPSSDQVEASINKFRAKRDLPRFNSKVAALDKAAQARADAMCRDNDWSHANDWAVLDKYYSYSYAGENLYYGWLQKDQADIAVRDWSKSPSHLANLTSSYTQIGVGVKYCPGFQDEPTAVIITNYFGVPR